MVNRFGLHWSRDSNLVVHKNKRKKETTNQDSIFSFFGSIIKHKRLNYLLYSNWREIE